MDILVRLCRPLLKSLSQAFSRFTSHMHQCSAMAMATYHQLLYVLAAPEVLTSARYDAKLADIWSAGVMLYTMLCCSYPFEKKEDDPHDLRTQTKIMQRIMKGTKPCLPGM